MPRYTAVELPDGWQVAPRPTTDSGTSYYLQRRRPDGLWEDVGGPYTRRHSAVQALGRLAIGRMEKEKRG